MSVRCCDCLPLSPTPFWQCVVFDSRNKLLRCSGCFFVLYCSRVCQRRHSHGDHKRLCHSMQHSDKSSLPFLSWPSQLTFQFNFGFLEPILFSGPNFRWLAYVISSDAQGVPPPSNSHSAVKRPPSLLVLDYDCDANVRVEVDLINLERESWQALLTRKYSVRVPKLKEMWQLYGSRSAKLPEAPSRASIPIFAFLPRGWQGEGKNKISQALAAILVVEKSTVRGSPLTSRYLKWLHCI